MDPPMGATRVNVAEEDHLWGGDDDVLDHYSPTDTDLQREWDARRNHFHTLGYRDGISAGKESEAQVGFNVGFKQAVVAGYNWGVARGAASAFAALSPSLKDLLLKDQDATKRLENLNSSVSSISSDEALHLYYEESIVQKGTIVSEECLQGVAALDTDSSVVAPQSKNGPTGCCGERGDCNLERLSIEPNTDDKPSSSGETREVRPRSNSSMSFVLSLSTDEETTISDTGYTDECGNTRPDLSTAAEAGTSDANRSSRPCGRLELLQGEVEKEFKSSVVKMSAFPS